MNGNLICGFKKAGRRTGLMLALSMGLQLCCGAQPSQPAPAPGTTAAEAGNAAAQDKRADEFVQRRNFLQAELWYRKAAKQGDAHGQQKLGEMLMAHAGLSGQLKPKIAANMGLEGIQWLMQAANHGDTMAQADLAGAYLNGHFVKADLLQAYKWGDLAASSPPATPGNDAGRAVRDAATQKMSFEQISKAKQLVVEFTTHVPFKPLPPDPPWVAKIKLYGISGPTNARLAIINDQTVGVGDAGVIKVEGKTVRIRCVGIRDKSVMIQIAGIHHLRELTLAN